MSLARVASHAEPGSHLLASRQTPNLGSDTSEDDSPFIS